MRYVSHAPAGPLAGYVARLWSLSDAPAHDHERIVPSGTLELVVNLDEDAFRIDAPARGLRRLGGIVVSGAYRRPFVVDTRHHASIVGVHFEPGGAAAFLGVAPGELEDEHVDLVDLWGAHARALRDELCTAPTVARRFAVLERALAARFAPRRHPAVQLALDQLGRPGASIGALAARAGVTPRRLHQLVREQVGLAPKPFDRIRRFQRVLARMDASTLPGWAQLAIEHGYCDQSHLIREAVELSGLTPSELRAQRGARVKENHLLLR